MNASNNFDKTHREYSWAPVDDVIIFWRSKVKVKVTVKYFEHHISWTTWAILMKLGITTSPYWWFWRSKVKGQGHIRPSRWRRHPHGRWGVEGQLLVVISFILWLFCLFVFVVTQLICEVSIRVVEYRKVSWLCVNHVLFSMELWS